MVADLLNELNTQQREAVSYIKGPSIILAGAGSGKTRVLVYKVVNLIENSHASPFNIVMITFTNKAANEMKERMGLKRLGYIGTFHSFCCQILRREGNNIGIDNGFVIYDEDDQASLIKSIIKKLEVKKFTPSYFLHRISSAKNKLILPGHYLEIFSDYNASVSAEVYAKYQKELRKNKALDFDDLILEVVNLFLKNSEVLEKYQDKYRYLLVVEFQDTNYIQYLLTKLLAEKYRNVTAVGDFSQSIYSWRGADSRNLEKFGQDFPEAKIFHLEQNYRSTQTILDFAYKVISKNQTHPVLNLFTTKKGGEKIEFYEAEDEEEEAIYVTNKIKDLVGNGLGQSLQHSSFAVLYRTNAQSRLIEEAFLHYSLPYILVGGTRFYERKEIKDVLSYLRLVANPDDEISQERIQKLGKKRWEEFRQLFKKSSGQLKTFSTIELMEKIFKQTRYLELYNPDLEEDYARIENIKELKSVAMNFPNLSQFLEQVALVESEYFEGEKRSGSKDGVRLMTLHQAKGLEFPVVFIVGVEEGILPHSRSIDDIFSLEEERRLFYVGITRAKRNLYITYTRGRFIFGRRGESLKSRFLEQDTAPFSPP
ncbi:UvrD-helicase domain-containing protein [Candidatus Roizmanbacteria bacterium]|nr:UvrD-helicase domain-containing protein [Candidatus Roizmanbacteria bacterium]